MGIEKSWIDEDLGRLCGGTRRHVKTLKRSCAHRHLVESTTEEPKGHGALLECRKAASRLRSPSIRPSNRNRSNRDRKIDDIR